MLAVTILVIKLMWMSK